MFLLVLNLADLIDRRERAVFVTYAVQQWLRTSTGDFHIVTNDCLASSEFDAPCGSPKITVNLFLIKFLHPRNLEVQNHGVICLSTHSVGNNRGFIALART